MDPDGADFRRLRDHVAAIHFMQSRYRSEVRYLFLASTLKRMLGEIEAEALLCLYAGGFAAMSFASGFRPYAVYVVGSDVLMNEGLKGKLTRLFLSSASRVFVNGSYLTERTRALAPDARLVSLYLGVDTTRFSPRVRPPSPVRIVCTRGFLPVYNNDYLIQGLARMTEIDIDFRVTFASGGALLDDSKRLADQLLSPKMRSRVEFLGGVSDERLTEEVVNSHIYVSTSRSDGTSSSLLEALACGLFPVLSDIPQNREWIDSKQGSGNGILVPLDQPEALGSALHTAIVNEHWRHSVADYNRSLVLKRADSGRNMATLGATLESIVRTKST
jgi:glycosyltransferase involved in cell wall biosynthesis